MTTPRPARDLVGRALRRGARALDHGQRRLSEPGGSPDAGPEIEDAPPAAAPQAAPSPAAARAAERARLAEIRLRRRFAQLYEQVRGIAGTGDPYLDDAGELRTPDGDRVRRARADLRRIGAERVFVAAVATGVGVEAAVVATVREMIRTRTARVARSFLHALEAGGELTAAAGVGLGMLAISVDTMPDEAWLRFGAAGADRSLRLAPVEFVTAGMGVDRDAVVRAVDAAIDGAGLGPADLLEVARLLFLADETVSRRVLGLVDPGLVADADERAELHRGVAWLTGWYGRRDRARTPLPDPGTAVPFAVLDYTQPDRALASRNLGDHVQSVASLGHLVRRTGLRFTGDPDLVAAATTLRAQVRPDRAVAGDDATLHLHRVDRDATNYAALPDRTWAIMFGWYMHPAFRLSYDVPFHPHLRPILVSMHVNRFDILTDDFLDYLRRYGPVGCRDWNSVAVLRAAEVPAFFSGCITTTIDTVFPPSTDAAPEGTLFVDTAADGPGDTWEQVFPAVRDRSFTENLADAIDWVGGYRDRYARVVTSRLHCYLPARSIGANVEFRPRNPSDVRFDGLARIDDGAYAAIRDGILTKLDAVLGAIAAGAAEDDVYGVWRELCAPEVAAAERRLTVAEPIAAPSLDVAAVCARIRSTSVTVERSAPAPDGDEIALEFSLDANYRLQLLVMLDSVVRHASRPVRVYVLCRGLDPDDFALIAARYPTVSFVWLPTDGVDYGPAVDLIRHLTVATMDRLLLPELLPVDRVVHLDLDAVCVGDVAELAAVDLAGTRLAARSAPQQRFASGFASLIRESKRLQDDEALARELIRRSHDRHAFDYPAFNAGVMVLDLARMRREGFCREFLPYAERFGLDDQDVLNLYAGRDRVELDHAWNRIPRLEGIADAKFVHWAGSRKPWDAEYVRGQEIWDEAVGRVSDRG